MKILAKQIYAASKEGKLPAIFGPKDVQSACPGWSNQTYGVFLAKHRVGNPGGETELFERVSPGLYRVLNDSGESLILRAQANKEADGRWTSWIDELPGCAAWGYSQEEALMALKDAADAYIEDMIEAGDEIPRQVAKVIKAPVVTITV